MYACHKAANSSFSSWTHVRMLPKILAKRCHMFSYKDCSFKIEPNKKNTARVIVWKEFKVTNSFTFEISIYGYELGEEVIRFRENDLSLIGEFFAKTISEYSLLKEQLSMELKESCGWLRLSRLNEITGTPLADAIKKEMAAEQEEKKKKTNIIKVNVSINNLKVSNDAKIKIPIKIKNIIKNPIDNNSYNSKVSTQKSLFSVQNDRKMEDQISNDKKNEFPETTDICRTWKDYFTVQEIEDILNSFNEDNFNNDSRSSSSEERNKKENAITNKTNIFSHKKSTKRVRMFSIPKKPKPELVHLNVNKYSIFKKHKENHSYHDPNNDQIDFNKNFINATSVENYQENGGKGRIHFKRHPPLVKLYSREK